MPFVTHPAMIEQSDFTLGWSPDGLNDSTEPSALLDVLNLLIDRNTGSLQTRKGYRRLREEFSATYPAVTANHYVKQLFHFGNENDNYLIAVLTDGTANADNVQLYSINLSGNAIQRIDTAGVTWDNPFSMFWFMSIDGYLYGGSKGNTIFRWNPSGNVWTADVATPNTKAWVDATGGAVNTATEYGRDNAWTGKEFVSYSGDVFMPVVDIKYAPWESGERYQRGDLVSRKGNGYWRSYKCISAHTAAAGSAPDTGASWETYWKRKKLPAPQDEDGNTNNQWTLIPDAAQTSIAMWFADRLWLRFDGQGDLSRAQYSAPVKPDKGEDIPNVSWNPKDWAPGNDKRGAGGGWVPFNDGKHGGVITAMHPFGQYGLVFKRRAVWAISGTDETTWNVRRLAHGMGAIGPKCVAELDGLVYFLSDDGLYVTDGTQVQEVPVNQRIQQWLRTRLDSIVEQMSTDGAQPQVFVHEGFIGISLPDAGDASDPYVTLMYDPEGGGVWKTDLPVLFWVNYRDAGVAKAAFCRAPEDAVTVPLDLVYIYSKANANDQDDTGVDAYAGTDIAWYLRTAWLPFGTARQERRIRRVWWVVKGAISMTIDQYRNWNNSAAVSTSRTALSRTSHIEGAWMADCHSISMKLSGASAPVSVYGYGVDTEPRRVRYHTN